MGGNNELMDAVIAPYMTSTVHRLIINYGNNGKQKSYQGNEYLNEEFCKLLSVAVS